MSGSHDPGEAHAVAGGGGTMLHVRAWGPPQAPPILFIHGWAGSHLGWSNQFDSPLRDRFRLVAFDLRGHGFSARPDNPVAYQDGAAWADDVARVMDAMALDRPVLVGWSYGGYVIGDYVERFGTAAIGAVNFVGAAALAGNPPLHIGPDFICAVRMAMDPDPAVMLDGLRLALDLTTHRPASPDARERAAASMALGLPSARGWMMMRTLDFGAAFARLACPCLISQGQDDRIVLPAMADYIGQHIPSARRSDYAECGHAPHLEASARFNQELAELVQSVSR